MSRGALTATLLLFLGWVAQGEIPRRFEAAIAEALEEWATYMALGWAHPFPPKTNAEDLETGEIVELYDMKESALLSAGCSTTIEDLIGNKETREPVRYGVILSVGGTPHYMVMVACSMGVCSHFFPTDGFYYARSWMKIREAWRKTRADPVLIQMDTLQDPYMSSEVLYFHIPSQGKRNLTSFAHNSGIDVLDDAAMRVKQDVDSAFAGTEKTELTLDSLKRAQAKMRLLEESFHEKLLKSKWLRRIEDMDYYKLSTILESKAELRGDLE